MEAGSKQSLEVRAQGKSSSVTSRFLPLPASSSHLYTDRLRPFTSMKGGLPRLIQGRSSPLISLSVDFLYCRRFLTRISGLRRYRLESCPLAMTFAKKNALISHLCV